MDYYNSLLTGFLASISASSTLFIPHFTAKVILKYKFDEVSFLLKM